MKQCILCHRRLGFVKFKSRAGWVCKQCYALVSLNYTQTITNLDWPQLQALYHQQTTRQTLEPPEFMITRRINQYILLDDTHQLLCLPNNVKFSGAELAPEYFQYHMLRQSYLEQQIRTQASLVCKNIIVQLKFQDTATVQQRAIVLVPKPIDIHSLIYATQLKVAHQLLATLHQIATPS